MGLSRRRGRYDLFVHIKHGRPAICQLVIRLHHGTDWFLVPERLRQELQLQPWGKRYCRYTTRRSSEDASVIVQFFQVLSQGYETEVEKRAPKRPKNLCVGVPDREELQRRETRLRQLYLESLPALVSELTEQISGGRDISSPFLVSLTAHAYSESSIRLMVVGRQTNGWANELMRADLPIEDLVQTLLQVYAGFQLGQEPCKEYMLRSPVFPAFTICMNSQSLRGRKWVLMEQSLQSG